MAFEKRPSERTQVVPRSTGSGGLEHLAEGLDRFFDLGRGILKEEKREEALRVKAENEAALSRIGSSVRERTEEAREAAQTGDFTNFIGADLAKRQVIQQAAPSIVGEQLGSMMETSLKDHFDSLGPVDDPDQAYADWLKTQTEGMNDLTAAGFRTSTDKLAETMIPKRRQEMIKISNQRVYDRMPFVVRSGLANGTINADNYEDKIAESASLLGGNIAKGLTDTQAIYDQALFQVYAESPTSPAGMAAARLIHETSAITRNPPEVIAEWQSKAVKQALAERNIGYVKAISEAENELNNLILKEKGSPGSTNTEDYMQAYLKGLSKATQYGAYEGSRFQTFKNKFISWAKDEASTLSAIKHIRQHGVAPAAKDAVLDKAFARLSEPQKVAAAAASGSPNQMVLEADNFVKSGDGGRAMFERLLQINAQTSLPMEGNHISKGLPFHVYNMMKIEASSTNMDAALAKRESYWAAIQQSEEDDPTAHFRHRRRLGASTSGTGRQDEGQAGEGKFLSDWVSENAAAMGWSVTDYGRLPDATQRLLKRQLGYASLMSSISGNDSRELISSLLTEAMKGDYEIDVVGTDGFVFGKDFVPVPRKTPRMGLDILGRPVINTPFDKEAGKSFEDWVDRDFNDLDGSFTLGVSADKLTETTGDRALTANGLPLLLPPGERNMDPEMYKLMKDFVDVLHENADGSVRVRPKDMGPVSQVGPRVRAIKDLSTDWYHIRYVDNRADDELSLGENAVDLLKKAGEFVGLDMSGIMPEVAGSIQDLSESNRETLAKSLRANTASFWDEARLVGNLRHKDAETREAARRELERRREAGSMAPKSPDKGTLGAGVALPWDGKSDVAMSYDAMDEADKLIEKAGQVGVSMQTLTANGVKEGTADPIDSIEKKLDKMVKKSVEDGSILDHITDSSNSDFFEDVAGFVSGREGFRAKAYKDVGQMAIGFGYSLDRPQAKAEVESLGLDLAKLKSGKQTINREQGKQLMKIALGKTTTWLRRKFGKVFMEPHKWKVLLSLAYNSKWTNGSPNVIGPNLQKYILEKRWDEAADEIEFRSVAKNTPKNIRKGLMRRRAIEAAMFRGAS